MRFHELCANILETDFLVMRNTMLISASFVDAVITLQQIFDKRRLFNLP
jgi:hypothetical protein